MTIMVTEDIFSLLVEIKLLEQRFQMETSGKHYGYVTLFHMEEAKTVLTLITIMIG